MKFERPKGFGGSIPRNWVDNNLPRCPFCKLPSLWEVGMEFKFTGWNRYHFRCPNADCMAILSIPVIDVSGGGVGTVDLWLIRKTTKKEKESVLKIESVGNHEKLKHLVGAEYPLKILQEWARQIHEGKKE